MPVIKLFISVFVFSLLILSAHSRAADVPGSRDLPGLERFPLSKIVAFEEEGVPEYWLATGAMRKINGVIRPEERVALSGSLTRITYEIPEGHTTAAVMEHFVARLEQLGFRELFRCAGRHCGSSNYWANQQFRIARLYGPDREQQYAAMMKGKDAVALYATQRGNKRVFLHLEYLSEQPLQQREDLLAGAQRGERLYLAPGASLDSLAEELRTLVAGAPRTRILLVGHSDQGGSVEERIRNARIDAEQIMRRLSILGVPESAMEVFSVGDLAPPYDAGIPPRRVEVLIR